MSVGFTYLSIPCSMLLDSVLEFVTLERGIYWLAIAALLCFSIFMFWKKRQPKPMLGDVDEMFLARKKTKSMLHATVQDNADALEAGSVHWQALNKQVLQLKARLEAKDKVLDHLMQHMLPQAIEVESLKDVALEVYDLVKQVQLAAHFNNQPLDALPTDFEQKLLLTHPALTEEELRLSSYIYLHLNSQQIAHLKTITVAGVNKARSRLRKKLRLAHESDLFTYLNELQKAGL